MPVCWCWDGCEQYRVGQMPCVFSYSVKGSSHYSSVMDQFVPLRCHFRFLPQMLFSQWEKDLGNEQKACTCVFLYLFPQTMFYNFSWKKKREIVFLTRSVC